MQPEREMRDLQIKRLYEEGMSQREIGNIYDLSVPRVHQILEQFEDVVRATVRRQAPKDFSVEVENLLAEHRDAIGEVAASGVSRAELVARFQLLYPEVELTIIGKVISAANAIFDDWRMKEAFSPVAIKAGFWYILARSLNIEADKASVLANVDFDLGEAREIESILNARGVKGEAVASVLCRVYSAREYVHGGPGVILTRKAYDDIRSQALGEFGISSRKGAFAWPPTAQTVMKRLGGGYWADALVEMGMKPSDRGRSRGLLKYTEQVYKSGLRGYFEYAARTNVAPSIQGYEVWVETEGRAGQDWPSAAAVIQRFKTWANVMRMATSNFAPSFSSDARKLSAVPLSTQALHHAQAEVGRFLASVSEVPVAQAPTLTANFIRSYVEEFEFRRRGWLRAAVVTDDEVVTRLLGAESLNKKQRAALSDMPSDIDAVLTDRYIDTLGNSDPRQMGGWLRPDAQEELDSVSDEVALQYKALREIRNYLTHSSMESRERLKAAIDNLAAQDPRFTLKQPITRKILIGWLRAKDAQRLRLLCGSIPTLWRAMVVGETLLESGSAEAV